MALFLAVSITLTSCSKDEPQESLTVTETISGTTVDQTFAIDAKDVFTDTKGFEFYLTWTPSNVDVDINADIFTEKANFQTGLNRYESDGIGSSETIKIENSDRDTFGKTLISVYSSYDGTISYNLVIKRISDGTVVKTATGSIQSTTDKVSFAGDDYHGFVNLGTFVKDGNKFGFDY